VVGGIACVLWLRDLWSEQLSADGLEGYYIVPSPPETDLSSLGEAIVRAEGRGAIASWSPTGLSDVAGHDVLNVALFEAILTYDIVELGPATTWAKVAFLARSAGYHELVDTYALLGDPALRLAALEADVGIDLSLRTDVVAGERLTYTIVYSNVGPTTAHHVVITNLLPGALLSPSVRVAGAELALRPGSLYVWDVADLEAGAGGAITVGSILAADFGGWLTHTVTIACSFPELITGNNVAEVTSLEPYWIYAPWVFR